LLFQAILILVAKHHPYSLILKEATVMAYPTIQYTCAKLLLAPVPALVNEHLYTRYSDAMQRFQDM